MSGKSIFFAYHNDLNFLQIALVEHFLKKGERIVFFEKSVSLLVYGKTYKVSIIKLGAPIGAVNLRKTKVLSSWDIPKKEYSRVPPKVIGKPKRKKYKFNSVY